MQFKYNYFAIITFIVVIIIYYLLISLFFSRCEVVDNAKEKSYFVLRFRSNHGTSCTVDKNSFATKTRRGAEEKRSKAATAKCNLVGVPIL